jgi:ubiquinol-cytochrome c reductase cytochrome c1 subunit
MRVLLAGLIALLPVSVWAAGGGGHGEHMMQAPVNMQDKVSLQNGARLFVNHCMGCHSLKYLRYGRMAEDLEIPEGLADKHLNFSGKKIGASMTNAMNPGEAEDWFGVAPPDLTLETRRRSADWVYSYLLGFYEDESTTYGYNNHIFENVAMPHVMADMEQQVGEEQFREAMGDITNFLAYAGEPHRMDRERIGVYVLVFLFILLIPAWFLYKEYWKDVD